MYLVDTSVWIDFIRGKPGMAVEQLRTILKNGTDSWHQPGYLSGNFARF